MFHDRNTPGSTPYRTLRVAVAAALALLLGACGAGSALEDAWSDITGSSSSSSEKHALEIVTESVPPGSPGVAYRDTQLTATGAAGPVTWAVAGGTLPPGLRLTEDGHVVGVPEEPGFYEFTAQASDGAQADQKPLAIAVDVFGVSIVDGLQFDEAWSGVRVHLRSAGHAGAVAFSALESGSRGRFEQIDPAAGTAVWVPGNVGIDGASDTLRAVDEASGEVVEITIPVMPNPAEHHVARFDTTDVWYLSFDGKEGVHPYATDHHAALARLGLRGAESTSERGTVADRLADLTVRVRVLAELNAMFLRERDGTEGVDGLAISFPLQRPGSGYSAPAPGTVRAARDGGYNVMAVCYQAGHLGALGVAFQDAIGNPQQEHNAAGGPAGELGVFINYVTQSVERSFRLYGDELKNAPVGPHDVEALKALLYDRPSPGGRYDLLRYHIDAIARSTAYIAAHEIGHSLGAPHLESYTAGGIMNGVALIGPGMDYLFVPSSLDALRRGLPGPARGAVAPQQVAALRMPAGGVHVCGHCK